MTKSLTSKDFFKFHACNALDGVASPDGLALSKAERYAQVVFAKTMRNFFFTSQIISAQATGTLGDLAGVTSITPRFSQPLIVTDAISMYQASRLDHEFFIEVTQYGGEGKAYGENYLGVYGPAIERLVIKHERNYSSGGGANIGTPDLIDKYLSFVPRLLRPYETLKVFYQEVPNTAFIAGNALPHLGFRCVRHLPVNDPYRALSALADDQVRRYINGSDPETFFLEARTTLASLGALGTGNVTLRTPQLERPVLILGAACNVEGVQARLTDESEPYRFTYQDAPLPGAFVNGLQYAEPPLVLWANNTDYRNVALYNMWAVPHVLEPGNSLKLTLFNGCLPAPAGGAVQQAAHTRSSQDVRITFLCRTV